MLTTNNAPRLAFSLTTALTATLLLNACGGGGATPTHQILVLAPRNPSPRLSHSPRLER